MPDIIDEKVVSMQFDNKQFEKGVEESLKSIQELKDSLKFDESVKNLDSLSKAGKKFDFSGVSDAVDAVRERFSALEIAGITALANLTNSAVNAAKNIASAVTIDPIKQGMGIYEQKMNSVQTILNNSGKSLTEVNEILQDLNDYSDQTIFSLNDMTTALGKFTAQGVDAKKAVSIIKGAANEAATMGAGSAEFGRMIYNLTQAYGMGSMKILDWKSFENANVAGKEFKEQIIESAIRLGKLDEQGRTLDKHIQVTVKNFREMLNTGFMDADVMTDTFEKYAGLNEEFAWLGKKGNDAAKNIKTFSQLMDVVSESVASQWSQIWSSIIGDYEEAKKLWTGVSTIFDNTIGKVITSRKEMMQLWHEGFIDPETNKQISGRRLLLDGLANVFQTLLQIIRPIKEAFREIFPAKTAENLWEATKAFRDFTAKLRLSESTMRNIKDFAKGLFSVLKMVRSVFKDLLAAIFPATSGVDSLLSVILQVAGAFGRFLTRITTAIRESEEYQTVMKGVGQAVMAVIKIIAVLAKVLFHVGSAVKKTGLLQKVLGGIAMAAGKIVGVVMTYGPKILTILSNIGSIVMSLVGLVVGGIGSVGSFFKNMFSKKDGKDAAQGVSEVADSVTELTKSSVSKDGAYVMQGFGAGLLSGVSGLMDTVKKIFGGIVTFVEKIFGTASPSKVFIGIGAFCLAGLLVGLTNPSIRSQISKTLSDFANSGIIQWFKTALTKGFNGIANVWSGAVQGITGLIHRISDSIQGLGSDSDTLAGKIARVFMSLVNGIKNLNWGAIVLTATIGTALVGVIKLLNIGINVASFFNTVGSGFRNLMQSFKVVSKGFNNLAKAIKRSQNPIVGTLRGIAFSLLAITASLSILSSMKDKDGLWTAAAVLCGSLLLIVALLTAAAKRIKAGELEDSVGKLSMMLLAVSAAFVLITMAFASMTAVISENQNSLGVILGAFGGMIVLTAMIGVLTYALSKVEFKSSLKAVGIMLAFTAVIRSVTKNLMKIAQMSNFDNLAGAVAALGVVIVLIAGLTWTASKIKFSGVLSILVATILLRTVVYAITSVDWSGTLKAIEDNAAVILGIIVLAGLMVYGASKMGSGIEMFGYGMKNLATAMLMMVGAIVIMKVTNVSINDIARLVGILAEVVGLYALILLITKYAKIPEESMNEICKIIRSLGLVMLEMGIAAGFASKMNDDGSVIAGMGLSILAFMLGITLILSQLDKAKGDTDLKGLAKLIKSFTLPIIALAILTKVYSGSTAGDIFGVILSLVAIFAGIAVVCTMVGNIKEEQVKFLGKMVGLLLVSVGGLVLLSMVPFAKLLTATLCLAAVMMSFFAITKGAAKLGSDSLKPLIAITVSMVVICGSLVALAYLTDWKNVLASAGAMAIVLLSLAASLAIVSSFGDKATKGAVAMVIASGALVVVAATLYLAFANMEWDTVWKGVITMLAVAGSVAAVGAFGKSALLGAAAMAVVAGTLVIVGWALNQLFESVDWGAGVGKMAAVLGILTGFALIFGIPALSEMFILGAIGLAMVGAALIVVGLGMRTLNGVDKGGAYIAGLAGSLMLMGIAGMILNTGAVGLIVGGLGLNVIALALRIMSGVDDKKINGGYLCGVAGGLMLMGIAGVLLTAGAAGLITGGLALIILSGGLAVLSTLNYNQLSKKNFSAIASGLLKLSAAGLAGIAGAPGLLALSAAVTALVGSLALLSSQLTVIITAMKAFGEEDAVQIGANVIQGMIVGMNGTTGSLMGAVGSVFTGFIGGICNILGIHSPSEVLRKIGQFTGLGFIEGWADSKFVQKLDQVSAAIAQDGVIAPFADTLANGFGNIGDVFSNIFKSEKEQIGEEISDLQKKLNSFARQRNNLREQGAPKDAIDAVTQQIDSIFARLKVLQEEYRTASDNALGSMFSGLQNGLSSLSSDFFPDLDSIINQTDFSMENMSFDAGELAGSLDDVSTATGKTTQKFGESMDMMSDFDRTLNTTINDIENQMINRLLGTEQWNTMLKNLEALGYDPALVKEIADMGMDSGYQYAAAFNQAGHSAAKVQEMNELFRKGLISKTELADWYESLSVGAENNEEGTRNLKKYIATEADYTGEGKALARGIEEDAEWVEQAYDANGRLIEARDETSEYYKQVQIGLKNQTQPVQKAADNFTKAQNEKNDAAADYAMSYMAESIKNAITKYMPASEFADIGRNVCIGFGMGVMSNADWSIEKVEKFAQSVIDSFCEVTKVESPSRVFKKIGGYIVEGLAIGLEDTTDTDKSTKELGISVIDAMREQMDKIQRIMESDDIWTPTIRPVVDLTNVQAGADNARLLLDGMQVDAAARDFSNYKLTTSAPTNTMAGMTKDEFARYLMDFANSVVEGIAKTDRTVTVPVNLVGDAKGVFKLVREENDSFKRATGYSALI